MQFCTLPSPTIRGSIFVTPLRCYEYFLALLVGTQILFSLFSVHMDSFQHFQWAYKFFLSLLVGIQFLSRISSWYIFPFYPYQWASVSSYCTQRTYRTYLGPGESIDIIWDPESLYTYYCTKRTYQRTYLSLGPRSSSLLCSLWRLHMRLHPRLQKIQTIFRKMLNRS